jgi:hypothetical protein
MTDTLQALVRLQSTVNDPKLSLPAKFNAISLFLGLDLDRVIRDLGESDRSQNGDLPPILKVNHITKYMGIAEPTVYAYMRLNDFPVLRIEGVKRVRREDFGMNLG